MDFGLPLRTTNTIVDVYGVLTDEHLQTNVPGVYAAGDCAEAFDKVSGRTIVSAIQPNAAEQQCNGVPGGRREFTQS